MPRASSLPRKGSLREAIAMSTTGTPVASVSRSTMSRLSAYSILVKPDVTFLVILTTMAGFYLGAVGPVDPLRMFNAIFGATLVAAGTAALNQYFERSSDAKMRRTSARPLPLGALPAMEAFTFGSGLIVLGAICQTFPNLHFFLLD